jgi:hypothetical protein
MKIRPVEAELFRADLQTDRHVEANSRVFTALRKRLNTNRLFLFRHIVAVCSGNDTKHICIVRPSGTSSLDFNILKTKRNLLYISNQFVPRCKHFPPRL